VTSGLKGGEHESLSGVTERFGLLVPERAGETAAGELSLSQERDVRCSTM
jgi:hypothetical protein